jgi:hypothetical protein
MRRLLRVKGFAEDEILSGRATNEGRTWRIEVTRDGERRLSEEAGAAYARRVGTPPSVSPRWTTGFGA